jgi:hypothetical protein
VSEEVIKEARRWIVQKQSRASEYVTDWPELPLAAWKDTYETLHMWTQIVGKVRMQRCAPINH